MSELARNTTFSVPHKNVTQKPILITVFYLKLEGEMYTTLEKHLLVQQSQEDLLLLILPGCWGFFSH